MVRGSGSNRIYSAAGDADQLLALDPEELTQMLLVHLVTIASADRGQLSRYNFGLPSDSVLEPYPANRRGEIREGLMEAWAYLETKLGIPG
jgi:hypothetical protein